MDDAGVLQLFLRRDRRVVGASGLDEDPQLVEDDVRRHEGNRCAVEDCRDDSRIGAVSAEAGIPCPCIHEQGCRLDDLIRAPINVPAAGGESRRPLTGVPVTESIGSRPRAWRSKNKPRTPGRLSVSVSSLEVLLGDDPTDQF